MHWIEKLSHTFIFTDYSVLSYFLEWEESETAVIQGRLEEQ